MDWSNCNTFIKQKYFISETESPTKEGNISYSNEQYKWSLEILSCGNTVTQPSVPQCTTSGAAAVWYYPPTQYLAQYFSDQ